MFEKSAEKIADKLLKSKTIAEEDKEVYVYGFKSGLTLILNLLTVIAIGAVFGMILESLAFMAFYMPFRSYAGGFHASTPWRCYGISWIMMAAVLIWLKFMPLLSIVCIAAIIIGSILCFVLAPVEDKNKPLDEKEQKVYKKRAYIILIVEICISAVMFFIFRTLFEVGAAAIFVEGIMLVLGQIKKTHNKRQMTNETSRRQYMEIS